MFFELRRKRRRAAIGGRARCPCGVYHTRFMLFPKRPLPSLAPGSQLAARSRLTTAQLDTHDHGRGFCTARPPSAAGHVCCCCTHHSPVSPGHTLPYPSARPSLPPSTSAVHHPSCKPPWLTAGGGNRETGRSARLSSGGAEERQVAVGQLAWHT